MPAITIAIAGIALGIAAMLISVAIVVGFKQNVSNKVNGFASDIEVLNIHSLQLPEAYPISIPQNLQEKISNLENVFHIQRVSQKNGVIKTHENFSSVTLRGLDENYDTNFLKQHIVEGKLPTLSSDSSSNEILISKQIAQRHSIKLGDKIYAYFFSESIKTRRFNVVGIYETHLKQFDANFAITDRYTVNKLNNWDKNQFSQLDIKIRDKNILEDTQYEVGKIIIAQPDLSTLNSREHYPQIYSWLDMLDLNVWVILILMLGVAVFTMISGILIIILERTQTIGILTALGASETQLKNVFIQLSLKIMLKGIIIGNIIGGALILLCKSNIISLDPETYYLNKVPAILTIEHWLVVNIATMCIIMATLLIPTHIISKIQPTKAIKFD